MSGYASKRGFLKGCVILISLLFLVNFHNVSSAPGQERVHTGSSAKKPETGKSSTPHPTTTTRNTPQSDALTPGPPKVLSKKSTSKSRTFGYGYRAALVMNAETREVVFEKNPHKVLLPASLTKMMLALLALEKVDQGLISPRDRVRVSERASRVGESQVYLKPGEMISFGDLMKAVLIRSANDAAVAVAEYISGSTVDFIRMMNGRARELGMRNTAFYNVHGLPSSRGRDNISTVFDMAILAAQLTEYPQALHWCSLQTTTIRDGTYPINNTNKLLGWFPGLDGLKTGFFRRAGFNIAATAKRGDLRLIAIVMGSPTSRVRFNETRKLLSIGFNHYQSMTKRKRSASGLSDKQAFLRIWMSSSPTLNF
jgi:D-alanyl-D-alanine carboxypeptidase (penicillin-binding protein 5/6)